MNVLEIRKRSDKSGLEPPRNVPDSAGNLPRPDLPEGVLLEPWPLAAVELVIGPPAEHEMSDTLVSQGIAEGWISLIRGHLILHFTNHADVDYEVLEAPGRHEDPEAPGGWRVEHRYRLRLAATELEED